jgi:oligo-1,6-glucosidase
MQWTAEPQAGFTSGVPWLPVNPNHVTINAADQVDDPDSVFAYYRRLIELRHSEPAVAIGDFHMLLTHDPVVYAFTRTLGDVRLLTVANFSSGDVHVDLSELPDADRWPAAEVLIANYPVQSGSAMLLRPWEARVYRRTADE